MISKSMHFGQKLPGRGLFRAFGEKGMHAVRFLPAKGPGPTQRERGTRAAARGGRDVDEASPMGAGSSGALLRWWGGDERG